MNCSSHAKVLLAFEEVFIEAGEEAARLAAEKASRLGLTVTYSDGINLIEVHPDGAVRTVKPLAPVRVGIDPVNGDMSLLGKAFDQSEFEG